MIAALAAGVSCRHDSRHPHLYRSEMRALNNIDVAFVCMNLPYTMPPDEAADAVRAFHPKVVIPYHYRGSDLAVFQKGLEGTGIEVRVLEWYP